MTDQPKVYVVHHHDIEKHAEHFNEGFDEAHRQGVGGEASRGWLTEKVVPLLKDHVDPESLYHVAEHIADALLSEADLDEALLTAAEVKVLTEAAGKFAYELGRKDAGEEIAARCERDVVYDTTARWCFAKIARDLTSQPSGAVSDERSGGST